MSRIETYLGHGDGVLELLLARRDHHVEAVVREVGVVVELPVDLADALAHLLVGVQPEDARRWDMT